MDRVTEELLSRYIGHRLREMRPKEEIEDEIYLYTKCIVAPNLKRGKENLV